MPQNVLVANVYGEGPNNGNYNFINFVSFDNLNRTFSELNPGYVLRYVDRDHDDVNYFGKGVHTKILYHMLTGNGQIVAGQHPSPIISLNSELSDHILSIESGDYTGISHADITVLTEDGPRAGFTDMEGNSFMVIEYSGSERYDGLGARHLVSHRGVSRRGGCALLDDPANFRKLPLIEGNNRNGNPSDEKTEPYVVADVHPVHIRGGRNTLEHYHGPGRDNIQEEIYFTGMILRGAEQGNPHVLYREGHVRPPKSQELPSYLHVHPHHEDPHFENWRLREGDIAFIPTGVVHRAEGEGDKEGGALVGVVAVPWFKTHNEKVVDLHK